MGDQPQPQTPVKGQEYEGGSKEDLNLPETSALRSPYLGLAGSQHGHLEQLVDPQVEGPAAHQWVGGLEVVKNPEDQVESDEPADKSDPQDVVIHTPEPKAWEG